MTSFIFKWTTLTGLLFAVTVLSQSVEARVMQAAKASSKSCVCTVSCEGGLYPSVSIAHSGGDCGKALHTAIHECTANHGTVGTMSCEYETPDESSDAVEKMIYSFE